MTKTSVRSLVNQAGILKLQNGFTTVFYGLKIEDDKFVYYTAKGIREILILKKLSFPSLYTDQALQDTHHMASIPCEHISEVVCLNDAIKHN